MANIQEIFGSRKTEGQVGVEIEVEGMDLPNKAAGWNCVPDGSLRNGGIEYVTNGAVTLEKLKELLANLDRRFKDVGSVIADAHRGSVHVHVNVQDKTPEQVFTTLFLWLLVEALWMDRCGPTRNGNLFCMSSGGSGEIIPYARQFLARHRDGAWYNLWGRGKYSALNTDCLVSFGSVEFRTFPSSTKSEKVLEWAGWCHRLVELGCGLDPDKLYVVWQELLNNPRLFFSQIFGEKEMKELGDYDLANYAEQGAEAASDMLFAWEEHKALLKNNKPAAPKPRAKPQPLFEEPEPEPADDEEPEDDENIDHDDEDFFD